MKQIQVVIDGETIEASKAQYSDPWAIGFPFGDRRFYGSEMEARAFIKREMKLHENNS